MPLLVELFVPVLAKLTVCPVDETADVPISIFCVTLEKLEAMLTVCVELVS